MRGTISFTWDKSAQSAAEAAAFTQKTIAGDTAYISHGEIQTGLSPDGQVWADQLRELYSEDFAELGDMRDLLVARTGDGMMVGVAIVAWEESKRRRFAVLEDMAVSPDHRSLGIGHDLMHEVKCEVSRRGVEWLFLESGVRNDRAHDFFEREGLTMTGHVFATRLTPAGEPDQAAPKTG